MGGAKATILQRLCPNKVIVQENRKLKDWVDCQDINCRCKDGM